VTEMADISNVSISVGHLLTYLPTFDELAEKIRQYSDEKYVQIGCATQGP